ncbi:Thioesterase/thiol ester dehydrase-isomerase [Sistotremastrum suecicum HHB10207 ss-3]|uniref:Thioesterase/thiol ester dehydrase-isomerase n=1 Tax=Sistotremastrum suecicum HHB10207 ss-3 TaxID=1314776 RepID=A0A166HW77_9AGAM|nr:Thioesterase/thiol ester dehydrase-isomerase [Sistotremastrum suecicum HHB10207 ss-3]
MSISSLRRTFVIGLGVSHKIWTRNNSSIHTLRQAFLDPNSPFHLPLGTQGPAFPDGFDTTLQEKMESGSSSAEFITDNAQDSKDAAAEGKALAIKLGHDPLSFWEHPVVWGDLDSFRHVNNVRYVRYLESGRIHWMRSFSHELGTQTAADILAAKGIGLILKWIDVDFKAPVLYPDTLLVAHKPHSPKTTSFSSSAIVYSYAQRRVVAESDSILVWYDYDKLRKTEPPAQFRDLIHNRMKGSGEKNT